MSSSKILILILILSAVLRFYKLGSIPPSLDWDETAHGYNAYSILKTARDEYGKFLPLYFRSFDDYKPPLYTYLVVPSVAIFGLNDFAVRFPSAFLGVLAVLFTYLMVKELFEKNEEIALICALFLAISPWHLQFSRVAFETNSAIFWSVLGAWAFLRGVRSRGKKVALFLSLSALAFGANLYMYHNARVFVPVFSLALFWLYRKELFQGLRHLILPVLITSVALVFLIPILTSTAGQLRFKGTAIFSDLSPMYKAVAKIQQDKENGQEFVGKIVHNRRLVYIPIVIDNYLSNFRQSYLFFTADTDRHHAPEIGLLYLWDLPFILAGIYLLIKKNFDRKTKIIIFWWFLAAPIAASVTWGVPHSLRTEIYLPTYQIFAALGFYYLIKEKGRLIAAILGLALFANFAFYLHQYYVHMPLLYSKSWLYGRKEAALFTEGVKSGFDKVIVSTKLEQPHEFWLYYTKYDPHKYLAEGGTVSGSFEEEHNRFDKYLFKPIDYQKQKNDGRVLFVGLAGEFPANVKPIARINYLNGDQAIFIVASNEK